MRLPAQLLRRKEDSCKNDFGHVFILAGSAGMLGAAALTAKSALRSGAGLVSIGVAKSLNAALYKKLADEVMTQPLPETKEGSIDIRSFSTINKILKKIDVLAIGPGLSRNASTQLLVRKIVALGQPAMVIDADGLNALSGQLKKFMGTKIITPHPGEMARLLEVNSVVIQKQRKDIAKSFAKKYNCIVVLKGHRTVVADVSGRTYTNKTGNPGMATAGSGDVLTGIIAGFLAQGLEPFKAAKCGVYLHGLAGDLAAREKTRLGLIASDITEIIPRAIKQCSKILKVFNRYPRKRIN